MKDQREVGEVYSRSLTTSRWLTSLLGWQGVAGYSQGWWISRREPYVRSSEATLMRRGRNVKSRTMQGEPRFRLGMPCRSLSAVNPESSTRLNWTYGS